MFDISWGKLVIIGVVALIVIGPKELPTVLRAVGQWMAKIRRMAGEFQGQFQDAMREAEMADLKKEFDETKSAVSNAVTSAFDTSSITNDLQKMVDDPTGSASAPTVPQTTPADPVALGTGPAVPEPSIDVPMPELPPPPESKDFAAPAAPAPAPEPAAPAASTPEAGGGKAA